jgi:hypothetical protein
MRFLLVVMLMVGFSTKAEENVVVKPVKTDCKNHSGVTRTIEVKTGPNGCEVYYTRPFENPKLIGSAKNQLIVCEQVRKKVVRILERAGLVCK